MKISLKSKHALIGGSSKGLGYAVAKQLAYSGAKVTLVARSEDLLKSQSLSLIKVLIVSMNILFAIIMITKNIQILLEII